MPKAYWIVHIDVHDPQRYDAYRKAVGAPLAAFGATFVVRGGPAETREGQQRARTVVIEFPTLADARACYDSAAYQAAKALRDDVATADLTIVEGWEA